jgi:glycolate oxidase iron-sulfur subunit
VTGIAALASCVHCGFCLQSCPTYVVTGDEADSPRGRIVLMQRLAAGTLTPADPHLRHHLDRCLGCRACEPVCPSAVEYGPALEHVKTVLANERPPTSTARVILHLIARPALRRLLFGAARLVRPVAGWLAGWSRPGFLAGMLTGSTAWRPDGSRDRAIDRATNGRRSGRGDVAVFLGCVQRELFGHVNAAAARTLTANGYAVRDVPQQGCCGALHAHAGQLAAARTLARQNVRAFAAHEEATVVATAAGCGAMLRAYGTLLADDPLADDARRFAARVQDVTELLADAGPMAGAPIPLAVAYDAPCHLLHVQRVADPPRAVLAAVPGLRIVPHTEADTCCGSAGLYSLTQQRLSRTILERKLAALAVAQPDVVVTGNPGCAMHLAAGLRASGQAVAVAHPVEILDASYARAGLYDAPGVDSPSP